jgi:hypothetical protein
MPPVPSDISAVGGYSSFVSLLSEPKSTALGLSMLKTIAKDTSGDTRYSLLSEEGMITAIGRLLQPGQDESLRCAALKAIKRLVDHRDPYNLTPSELNCISAVVSSPLLELVSQATSTNMEALRVLNRLSASPSASKKLFISASGELALGLKNSGTETASLCIVTLDNILLSHSFEPAKYPDVVDGMVRFLCSEEVNLGSFGGGCRALRNAASTDDKALTILMAHPHLIKYIELKALDIEQAEQTEENSKTLKYAVNLLKRFDGNMRVSCFSALLKNAESKIATLEEKNAALRSELDDLKKRGGSEKRVGRTVQIAEPKSKKRGSSAPKKK